MADARIGSMSLPGSQVLSRVSATRRRGWVRGEVWWGRIIGSVGGGSFAGVGGAGVAGIAALALAVFMVVANLANNTLTATGGGVVARHCCIERSARPTCSTRSLNGHARGLQMSGLLGFVRAFEGSCLLLGARRGRSLPQCNSAFPSPPQLAGFVRQPAAAGPACPTSSSRNPCPGTLRYRG